MLIKNGKILNYEILENNGIENDTEFELKIVIDFNEYKKLKNSNCDL